VTESHEPRCSAPGLTLPGTTPSLEPGHGFIWLAFFSGRVGTLLRCIEPDLLDQLTEAPLLYRGEDRALCLQVSILGCRRLPIVPR
jgi:hypothetical protein